MGCNFEKILAACTLYYKVWWAMLVRGASYDDVRKICGAPSVASMSKGEKQNPAEMTSADELHLFTAVWLHTLGLNFVLWDKPHYRADSLRHDLVENFSNIAFPGTGIPMSWLCCCRHSALFYLMFWHPLVVFGAAMAIFHSTEHRDARSFDAIFEEHLLAPKHWFALWRINSTLVAAHHEAHADTPAIQNEYRYENKWDFVELALKQEKLPASEVTFKVSPVMTTVAEIVCKHKNIEGGMGIHMYKSATHGGDWILQERLYNCDELEKLLPDTAPLSTFRVITMVDPTAENSESQHVAMTFVWRAGRAGKNTDHSSVLFAVDPDTLEIKDGKAFSNWYGVGKCGLSNLVSKKGITTHPDTGLKLSGVVLECARSAVDNCRNAHKRLMPNVPAIGWDVAVAKDHGSCLLEANLSCNFFGGIYDRQRYLRIVDSYYANNCRPGDGKK